MQQLTQQQLDGLLTLITNFQKTHQAGGDASTEFSETLTSMPELNGIHGVSESNRWPPFYLLDGMSFDGLDFTNWRNLNGVRFNRCSMQRANLNAVHFESCGMSMCNLDGADLSESKLIHGLIEGCSFRRSCMFDAVIEHCNTHDELMDSENEREYGHTPFRGLDFYMADLSSATFRLLNISRCNFQLADLHGATIDQCRIATCDLTKVDLSTAILTKTLVERNNYR